MLSLAIAVTGTTASVGGLLFAGWQARKARHAAVAARTASEEAREAVFGRETAIDLASVMAGLSQVREAARTDQPALCLVRIEQASEVAARLKARDAMLANERAHTTLQDLLGVLNEFEQQIETALLQGDELRLEGMLPVLGSFRSELATLDEALR